MRKTFMVFGLILGFVAFCFAKEPVELEEIVVTAPKKRLKDMPGTSYVIDKKEIRLRNVLNPAKALEHLPGIYIRTGKGFFANQQQISIRGMSETRSQILRDGHRMNSSFYASMKSWNQFSIEDIEKIEVIMGPYSALYGGWNGLGGVINIITRMPEKRQFCIKTLYGTDGSWGGTFSYGDKFFDKLSILFSYDYKSTDGYVTDYIVRSASNGQGNILVTGWRRTYDKEGNLRYLIGDKGDYRIRNYSIFTKIRLDLPHDSKLTFTFDYYRYNEHFDFPHNFLRDSTGRTVWNGNVTFKDQGVWKNMNITPSIFLGKSLPRRLYRYALDYEIPFNPKNILKLSFELNDERWERKFGPRPDSTATFSGGPGNFQRNPKSLDYRIRAEYRLKELFGFNNLIVGAEYYEERGGRKRWQLSNWLDEDSKLYVISESWGRNRIVSFFAQDEINLIPKLTMIFGGRVDYWRLFNRWSRDIFTGYHPAPDKETSYFSPKFSLRYEPFETTAFRFSIAKSFNAPMLHDLIGGYCRANYVSLPSPKLKPEKVLSWEIGIDQSIKNISFTGTYFEHHISDLRYRKRYTQQGITYSQYENADEGRIRGFELGVEWQIFSFLSAYANYTYQDAKITENSIKPETEGKRMTMIPQKMCNSGIIFSQGPFKSSLTFHYVGKIYSDELNRDKKNHVYGSYDPYYTLDAKITYTLKKGLELSFYANNLLNKKYYQSYLAPGAYLFGEITYRFGY